MLAGSAGALILSLDYLVEEHQQKFEYGPLVLLSTLGMMLLYSWKLALVTLAAVALYLGLRWVSFAPM